MDDIKSFYISVDLTNCASIYDYSIGKRLEKPEGGWDVIMSEIKHNKAFVHTHVDPWVDAMDVAWRYTKLLEKEIDPDGLIGGKTCGKGDKHFQYELPPRILPVYQPGNVVKGFVVLDVEKPLSTDKLVIDFTGQARFVVEDAAYHENKYIVHETQSLLYSSKEGSGTMFATSSKMTPTGRFKYPFNFHVPYYIPGSIPPMVQSGDIYLMYRLKATMIKGALQRNIVVNRGLWVERPFDVATDPWNLPIKREAIMKTGIFGTSGCVTLGASLPRQAWVHGGTVPINIDLDNQSPNELDKVQARIVLLGKEETKPKTIQIKYKTAKHEEFYIAPGMKCQFLWKIHLIFQSFSTSHNYFKPPYPDNNLLPVGIQDVFEFLKIGYVVQIKVKRKKFQKDIKLEIPIIIGTEDKAAMLGEPGTLSAE